MTEQLHLFEYRQQSNIEDDLRAFSFRGEPTQTETIDGTRYFINEFWTSRQRQAHRLHEISYRACFKPQLPAFFIERLTAPGDIVYDPFMGRGTTPLEAALRRRVPYGNDTNPLSRALVEPRINPPFLGAVRDRLAAMPWDDFHNITRQDLLTFYHPKTLAQIEGLRGWLLDRQKKGLLDNTDRWIRMVALNRLTGHSPGFFSVYTLPPNQAVTIDRQKKINEKRGQTPPMRDVPALILHKTQILLSHGGPESEHALFLTGQSDETPEIRSGTVALTVTSPPFLDIVDYVSDNWLRCWFIGVDPKNVRISQYRKVEEWRAFIARTLQELARITRPSGHVAFEVGEVRRGKVLLEKQVIEAACGLPFDLIGVMINQQEFTKTSNCWGISNNSGGTNSNRIVLFRKRG